MTSRVTIPLMAAVILTLSSCVKTNGLDHDDEPLGEFGIMVNWIDMNDHNQFNKSDIAGVWNMFLVETELYEDGSLVEKKEETDRWVAMEYNFEADGTMSYSGDIGRWIYTHNRLVWRVWGCYYVGAVEKLTKSEMVIKVEENGYGGNYTPYFVDTSGGHFFTIFHYKRTR